MLKLCSLLHENDIDFKFKIPFISIFLLKLCSLLHWWIRKVRAYYGRISIFLLKLCSLLQVDNLGNGGSANQNFNLLVEAMFSATIFTRIKTYKRSIFQSSCWSYVLCYKTSQEFCVTRHTNFNLLVEAMFSATDHNKILRVNDSSISIFLLKLCSLLRWRKAIRDI